MTPEPFEPLRLIVTGTGADGRSRFVSDGAPSTVKTVAARPGYRVMELWRTLAAPADLDAADSTPQQRGVSPPAAGTVCRVLDIPPEPTDPVAVKAAMDATFSAVFADDAHRPANAHPAMHRTDSIDYAILLAGELTAIMDDGETTMHAGDVLIQRGTNHRWSNRSGKMARIAFILVDGRRAETAAG